MLALQLRQAQAIAQETFYQNDDITAVRRPHTGLGEGQRHVMVGAAFAATNAGKMGIHGRICHQARSEGTLEQ